MTKHEPMTVNQVAALYGVAISTVSAWCRRGEIPAHKGAKAWTISRAVDRWPERYHPIARRRKQAVVYRRPKAKPVEQEYVCRISLGDKARTACNNMVTLDLPPGWSVKPGDRGRLGLATGHLADGVIVCTGFQWLTPRRSA